jgi:2-methylisocitrate lyase-like PEP mutase family enzyme
MLRDGEMIVAPGAYDGATAMLVEAAGYDAVYMTGAGVSSTFGLPDYGLLTLTEMAGQAGRLARAVSIPVIADADTGYGNELNVTRTIHEYEAAGVAALHIEDQLSPKRCGHLTGKEIVPREEFLIKIRAALAARRDPDLVIIARTDARAVAGMDEAIWRANAALESGADIAFVEAMQSVEEAAAVPGLVHGPCLLNMVKGGVTPVNEIGHARRMGFAMVIAPALVFGTVVGAALAALRAFRETGVHPDIPGGLTPADVFALFGAAKWDLLRSGEEG